MFAAECVFICLEQLHVRLLPGISLTVVLPGYNVFKQFSSGHPGRERAGGNERRRRRRREGRKSERDREARGRSC